jgi:hypothetical protein
MVLVSIESMVALAEAAASPMVTTRTLTANVKQPAHHRRREAAKQPKGTAITIIAKTIDCQRCSFPCSRETTELNTGIIAQRRNMAVPLLKGGPMM